MPLCCWCSFGGGNQPAVDVVSCGGSVTDRFPCRNVCGGGLDVQLSLRDEARVLVLKARDEVAVCPVTLRDLDEQKSTVCCVRRRFPAIYRQQIIILSYYSCFRFVFLPFLLSAFVGFPSIQPQACIPFPALYAVAHAEVTLPWNRLEVVDPRVGISQVRVLACANHLFFCVVDAVPFERAR